MDELTDFVNLSPEAFELLLNNETEDLEPEMLIILRAIQSYEAMDQDAAPEEHLAQIYKWFEETLSQKAAVDMVLRGELYVVWKPEEEDVAFRLTPEGAKRAAALGLGDERELPEW